VVLPLEWLVSRELSLDLEAMNFVHDLVDVAAAGGDTRERLFA